jgi:hypothetical protein
MNIDTSDGQWLARWRHPQKRRHMDTAARPPHDYSVLFSDHILDGKMRAEGATQHLYPAAQARAPITLSRQWIVLNVRSDSQRVERVDVPCIEDIGVVPPYSSFVLFDCHSRGSFHRPMVVNNSSSPEGCV